MGRFCLLDDDVSFFFSTGRYDLRHFFFSFMWAGLSVALAAFVRANGRIFCNRPRLHKPRWFWVWLIPILCEILIFLLTNIYSFTRFWVKCSYEFLVGYICKFLGYNLSNCCILFVFLSLLFIYLYNWFSLWTSLLLILLVKNESSHACNVGEVPLSLPCL